MNTKSNFFTGKIGVIPGNSVTASVGGRPTLGNYDGCPAGYVRNDFGVCMLAQPVGTTYFVQTLAGQRPGRK